MPLRWVACGLLLAGAFAVPATLGAEPQWTYGSSPHFEVYTTGGPKRARAVLGYFERVHTFFTDVLHLTPVQSTPTRLVVFSSAREYKPYRLNDAAIAYYQGGPDRDYIVMQDFGADSYPIVVHEYAHLIIRHSGDVFPVWLNEGLAEFYSTIEPQGGQMSIGRVPRGRLRDANESGPLLSLPRLFAVAHDSPEYKTSDHAGLFYGESWALVHMVYTHAEYRQHTQQFLAAVAGGASSADAFQSVYGKTPAQVFGDLRTYVQGSIFNYYSTNYHQPPAESTFALRPAEPFEARLVEATLLAEGPAPETAARSALDALAQERPDDLGVIEARGYFEWRHGRPEGARPYFAKAVALGSRNARLYRDYAGFVGPQTERVTLLEKSLALDPDDLGVRLMYASTLEQLRQADKALSVLAAVTKVPADRAFSLFQLRANANLMLGKFTEAGGAAGLALRYARPGEETTYATNLVNQIAHYAELAAGAAAGPAAEAASPAGGASMSQDVAAMPPAEPLRTIAGEMTALDCSGAKPVMVVAVKTGGTLRLLIDAPNEILLTGAEGPTTNLHCGPQHTALTVGFLPDASGPQKTSGLVREITFLK
jgi:hypothetical protein